MDKQTILALKLKDYRDKNGLTQAQLAEQLEDLIKAYRNGKMVKLIRVSGICWQFRRNYIFLWKL